MSPSAVDHKPGGFKSTASRPCHSQRVVLVTSEHFLVDVKSSSWRRQLDTKAGILPALDLQGPAPGRRLQATGCLCASACRGQEQTRALVSAYTLASQWSRHRATRSNRVKPEGCFLLPTGPTHAHVADSLSHTLFLDPDPCHIHAPGRPAER